VRGKAISEAKPSARVVKAILMHMLKILSLPVRDEPGLGSREMVTSPAVTMIAWLEHFVKPPTSIHLSTGIYRKPPRNVVVF
jgi:hypothetical protein